jgi:hypothetical protein
VFSDAEGNRWLRDQRGLIMLMNTSESRAASHQTVK